MKSILRFTGRRLPEDKPDRCLAAPYRQFMADATACFDISKVFRRRRISVQVSAQPPAKKTATLIEKETNEHRTSNTERPTSNNVFCQFYKKMTERTYSAKKATKTESEPILRYSIFCGSLVLKSIKRSVINIRRSMLGVRCSTFNLIFVPTMCSFI